MRRSRDRLRATPRAAAATINKWFGDNTHGKIKKLIDACDLDAATALVLTDAVYLDAQWAHGFDPKRTAPAPFHLADGGTANVPTMHLDSSRFQQRAVARLRGGRGLEGGVIAVTTGTSSSST